MTKWAWPKSILYDTVETQFFCCSWPYRATYKIWSLIIWTIDGYVNRPNGGTVPTFNHVRSKATVDYGAKLLLKTSHDLEAPYSWRTWKIGKCEPSLMLFYYRARLICNILWNDCKIQRNIHMTHLTFSRQVNTDVIPIQILKQLNSARRICYCYVIPTCILQECYRNAHNLIDTSPDEDCKSQGSDKTSK